MIYFKSTYEKRLWIYVIIVIAVIFSTLFMGRPLSKLIENQLIQSLLFLFGTFMIGITTIAHGLTLQTKKIKIAVLLGFLSIYVLIFLRLGLSERSHLIEYGVLALFIHKALIERFNNTRQIKISGWLALILTILIGVIDELIQLYIPDRIFDPYDIVFNCLAAIMAIGTSIVIQWLFKKINNKSNTP